MMHTAGVRGLLPTGSQVAVGVAECYADGSATRQKLQAAHRRSCSAVRTVKENIFQAARLAYSVTLLRGNLSRTLIETAFFEGLSRTSGPTEEQLALCSLVRCVGSSPFRPLLPCAFPVHVHGLAKAIHAAFPDVSEDYLILADPGGTGRGRSGGALPVGTARERVPRSGLDYGQQVAPGSIHAHPSPPSCGWSSPPSAKGCHIPAVGTAARGSALAPVWGTLERLPPLPGAARRRGSTGCSRACAWCSARPADRGGDRL
jgi:hypothetical protein